MREVSSPRQCVQERQSLLILNWWYSTGVNNLGSKLLPNALETNKRRVNVVVTAFIAEMPVQSSTLVMKSTSWYFLQGVRVIGFGRRDINFRKNPAQDLVIRLVTAVLRCCIWEWHIRLYWTSLETTGTRLTNDWCHFVGFGNQMCSQLSVKFSQHPRI